MMIVRTLPRWTACVLVVALSGTALAQGPAVPPPAIPPQLPSQSDISRARVGLPAPEAPDFDLSIQTPERSAIPRSVDSIDFTLSRVVVEGATVFPPAEVDAIFAGLTGRTVQLEEVRAAAAKLEDKYRARGFFLSRVFVPPQRLDGGALTIRVIEGYIDAVNVDGLDGPARSQAAGTLRPLTSMKPAELAAVERQLLILNDTPGVTANSVLRQSAKFGASDLYVSLAKPRDAAIATVSNANSRILGPWVYALSANAARPLGLPGAITTSVSASGPDLDTTQSASVRYSAGLGSDGLVGSVGAIAARANPRGSLAPLDVRNRLVSVSARLRYPLLRSRPESVWVEGGLSVNRSTTNILGQEVVDDRNTVADVALVAQQSGWLGGSTTASVDLYRGLDLFGAIDRSAAMPSVAGFDPTFTRVTFSVQRVQTIAPRLSALFALQGQYSDDKLLTGELVAFGGPAIGRGYDPSTIVGDRGVGGLAEVRYDLPLGEKLLENLQFYAFIDGAKTVTLASLTAPRTVADLASAGGGLRLSQRRYSIDLLLAKAFDRFAGPDRRDDPRLLVTASAIY